MTLERPMILIVDKIADESRRRRNSAIVWLTLGAITQAGIVYLLLKAESFADASAASKLGFFFFASFFCAWLPVAAAIYYFRRSRKMKMRSGNLLCRALTGEPQLIGGIYQEKRIEPPAEKNVAEKSGGDDRAGEAAGAVAEGVLDFVLSAIFVAAASDTDATSGIDYNTSSNQPIEPRVFVRLTNGEKYEIAAPFSAAETIAALRRHAPHAAMLETI